jgi:hypothetical protein
MQQLSKMLSITMPKRTELSNRSTLSSTESPLLEVTLTAGPAAGGASVFEAISVLVVAIPEYRRETFDPS